MKTFQMFVEEIKGWKHAASDLAKARKAKSDASKSVVLHQLTAKGTESGMYDARKHFSSEEDAHSHIESRKSMNPGKKFSYNKYVDGQHVGVVS